MTSKKAPVGKAPAFNPSKFVRPGLNEDEVAEIKEAFDLFGNTVAVPVVKAVATRLLNAVFNSDKRDKKRHNQLELI